MNLSLLSSLHGIHYEEGNLQALVSTPVYFNCGVQLLCTCGEGLISTGAQQFHLCKMSELIFWGGSIMQLIEASNDFHVRMLLYPEKVFLQAAIALDTTYFNYMRESPQYNHGEKSWRDINLWVDLGEMLFTQPPSTFSERMELNFLQSLLMWIFSTIPDTYISVAKSYTRKQQLFHKFMYLVHEHAAQMHQVSFYAEQLCISQRYLNNITETYSGGKTPKALIDEQLTAELKVLLNNPALSIAEIATACRFPDSSYLSRFFKKNTGLSPKEFRTQRQP
ncbi:helix-turn-helix domain-containing protein [Mediterranea massiliensis]|uniref:helix-turn-helix domain-containing protein n=1 Tax=Mediterranea massiliensis TaxID=1841865 RepID=UPI0025A38984|nr:helix-turn-helix domain-containing protein [Mediterranea massiliensis]MDM8337288.1 helix-turn-helix domain-containing protein [Mediterranea massiliensis]